VRKALQGGSLRVCRFVPCAGISIGSDEKSKRADKTHVASNQQRQELEVGRYNWNYSHDVQQRK
jgi:hypothetical protein